MNNFILSAIVKALSATTLAANIVNSDSQKVSLTAKENIQVKIVETTEACVLTYDPQWADDEDTREARTIFDNFAKTDALLKKMRADGFVFSGLQNKEVCGVDNSTFPEVLASNDSLYFSRFVSPLSMAKAAKEQKAFKKVRRVYIKGFNSLENQIKKEVMTLKAELLKRYL
jgi:hypothetical protein